MHKRLLLLLSIMPLVMTGCAVVLSLGNIQLENISLGRILAIIIVLICARYGSVTGGAVSGACTGVVFGISTSGLAFISGSYSGCEFGEDGSIFFAASLPPAAKWP